MGGLGDYALTLTAAALICGILLSLFPEGRVQKLLRLVFGVFLTVTALAPLPGLELPEVTIFQESFATGEDLAALGRDLAAEETARGIRRALDAYILDKAAALGITLETDITLDPAGCPVALCLTGTWTGEDREKLAAAITKELGIPREAQQWNEENGTKKQETGWSGTGGQS